MGVFTNFLLNSDPLRREYIKKCVAMGYEMGFTSDEIEEVLSLPHTKMILISKALENEIDLVSETKIDAQHSIYKKQK